MAISTIQRKRICPGNGSATIFNFPFKVIEKSNFILIYTNMNGEHTILKQDTDYSLSNVGEDSGVTVTYPISTEVSKLQSGEKLTGYRETNITQLLDFMYDGGFSPRIHENAFDKVTMILQELAEELDRRPMMPITSSVTSLTNMLNSLAKADGSNIDPIKFVASLGIKLNNGEIDLTDLCKTDASNASTEAFRSLVGMAEIENDLTETNNNINDLSMITTRTDGSNIQVEEWQNLLGINAGIRPQTIIKGAVGDIPNSWQEGWCDKPAQHIVTSGTSELTIRSGLQVAAGVEGKVLLSNELESDTSLDISSAIAQTNGTFYAYADIGTTGSMSFGYTESEPQVAPCKQNLMKLNLNMTANSSPSPYVASASSNYSGRLPYLAFDGKIKQGLTTSWQQANSGDLHPWLQIDLGSSILINKYSIHSNTGDALRTPISWTFQGSLDGSNWVDLDVVTDSTSWSKGEYRTFEFETDDSYRYFRLYNMSSEYPNYTNISEVELFRKLKGDFYNISNHTHYDKDGNILKRVYLGEFEVADGVVEKVINYQHGTTCTLPVNDGEVLPVNSTYYLDKQYLGNAKADVRIFAEDKWGLPNWVSVNGAGYGTAAFVTDGILSVVTGSARLYYGGTGYGAGEFSSYGTTSYLAKVTVTREW